MRIRWKSHLPCASWTLFGIASVVFSTTATAVPRISGSTPPHGSVDARQPYLPNGLDPQGGWDLVFFHFDGEADNVTAADLEVQEIGGDGEAPDWLFAGQTGIRTIAIFFTEPFEPATWTCVRHIPSCTAVCLGFLPGDVNGDLVSTSSDVLRLIDSINGVCQPPPPSQPACEYGPYQTDIDRSGMTNPADVLREIDLLNGAEQYAPYNGTALPNLGPDLILRDLHGPPDVRAGESLLADATIANGGTQAATGFSTIGWFLSSDAAGSPDDTALGQTPVPLGEGISPCGSLLVSQGLNVPESVASGDYYLIACLNTQSCGTLCDIDASNNCVARPVEVQHCGDVEITNVSVPHGTKCGGDEVAVTVSVCNLASLPTSVPIVVTVGTAAPAGSELFLEGNTCATVQVPAELPPCPGLLGTCRSENCANADVVFPIQVTALPADDCSPLNNVWSGTIAVEPLFWDLRFTVANEPNCALLGWTIDYDVRIVNDGNCTAPAGVGFRTGVELRSCQGCWNEHWPNGNEDHVTPATLLAGQTTYYPIEIFVPTCPPCCCVFIGQQYLKVEANLPTIGSNDNCGDGNFDAEGIIIGIIPCFP